MKVVLLGDLAQLSSRRVHYVHPGKRRLAAGENGLDRHDRQIRLAAAAAPNPLSMLTTVTPDAQELSMARSAARPPKDAPYPTLVGTAMTGTATSPPTTLARAPSIPATTMMTRADMRRWCSASRRWSPATPTSYTLSTWLPIISAVTAASSATGRSAVPAA